MRSTSSQRARDQEWSSVPDQRTGAVSNIRLREIENRLAQAPLSCPVSVPCGRTLRLDIRAHPDLVSFPHADRTERAGVAGAANEQPRMEVPAKQQLLYLAGRFPAGAGADERAAETDWV